MASDRIDGIVSFAPEGSHHQFPSRPRSSFRWGLSAWRRRSTASADHARDDYSDGEIPHAIERPVTATEGIFSRGPTPSFAESQMSTPLSPTGYYCENPSHEMLVSRTELRQQRAWTRRRGHKHGHLNQKQRESTTQAVYTTSCLAFVVLLTILLTYISLVATKHALDTGVHVALVLLIVLTAVVFLWTLVRLCSNPVGRQHRTRDRTPDSSTRGPRRSQRQQHHHQHQHGNHRRGHRGRRRGDQALPSPHLRIEPGNPDTLPEDDTLYTPTTPIRVHVTHDELWEKTPEQQLPSQTPVVEFEREIVQPRERPPNIQIRAPPPAYGLWRCSVRADPNLLHWARSPTEPSAPSPDAPSTSSSISSFSSSPTDPDSPAEGENDPAPSEFSTAPPSYATHPPNERASVFEHPVGGLTPIPEMSEAEAEEPANRLSRAAGQVPEMIQRPRDFEVDEVEDWPLRDPTANQAVMQATRMLLSRDHESEI